MSDETETNSNSSNKSNFHTIRVSCLINGTLGRKDPPMRSVPSLAQKQVSCWEFCLYYVEGVTRKLCF